MNSVVPTRRLLAALILLPALLLAGAERPDPDGTAYLGELAKIAKDYQIEIVTANVGFPVKTTYGPIDGKDAGEKDLREYTRLFTPEFSAYPPSLIRKSRLQRVILCRDLSYMGQRRNAIPDFEHNSLYLDVSRGAGNKVYLRQVIHHEFFHVIDYRDDGNLQPARQGLGGAPARPSSEGTAPAAKSAQGFPETSLLTSKYPGFLNHYSTTGVEEDKAEMFANMIVNRAYVDDRAKDDRVLKTKVERMKDLMATFCPEMNDMFWEKVERSDRSDP